MNDTGRLFGAQREALQAALMAAFFRRARLEEFLSLRLDKDLEDIASEQARGLGDIVLSLLKDAQAEVFVRVGSSSWVRMGTVGCERRLGTKELEPAR